MTEFKPGDVVQHKTCRDVQYRVFQVDGYAWRTSSSAWMDSRCFERVEPSIPVSKIREVCLQYLKTPTSSLPHNSNMMAMIIGANDALRSVFEELTGEPLRKEIP